MSKWNSKTQLSAAELSDSDLVPVSDESEADGSKDKTASIGAVRAKVGAGVTVLVGQTAHGLSVGDVLRHNGTSYVAATATTETNAEAVGVVTTVPDVDTFTYQTAGLVTGLSGLTAGELYYLKDDGSLGTTAGTVEKPILIAVSATSAVLILAISGEGGGGGGNAYYDLQLGFPGAPDAGATDTILSARAVTIDDADPAEVYVGTNPTDGTADIDVQKNGSSVGTLSITTAGAASWSLSADIELAAGDRIAIVAPSPADSTLAELIVAFKGTAS